MRKTPVTYLWKGRKENFGGGGEEHPKCYLCKGRDLEGRPQAYLWKSRKTKEEVLRVHSLNSNYTTGLMTQNDTPGSPGCGTWGEITHLEASSSVHSHSYSFSIILDGCVMILFFALLGTLGTHKTNSRAGQSLYRCFWVSLLPDSINYPNLLLTDAFCNVNNQLFDFE